MNETVAEGLSIPTIPLTRHSGRTVAIANLTPTQMHHRPPTIHPRSAFTLIELLVVIAIIAILSVVVILTLNPAELLRQSRDANRVSDMATINGAFGIYAEDVGGSMGTPSTTYISILDPTATSTAGDQCQGLILPAQSTSSGWTYQCGASSSYRNVNGTGWTPLNFTTIASGAPFGSLPQDPINQTSSNLFYTYTTDGNTYEATAVMESQKYRSQFSTNPPLTLYPGVDAVGTNLALSGLWNPNGLVGYWNFDEGKGSSTIDQSGNGNTGSWSGTPAGNNGTYYTGGKVGQWAGAFDGSTDYVSISGGSALTASSISAWINPQTLSGIQRIVVAHGQYLATSGKAIGIYITGLSPAQNYYSSLATNSWSLVAATWDGSTVRVYLNANLVGSWSATGITSSFGQGSIGDCLVCGNINWFPGLVDDARVYNRALSAAEIQALYNAQK